MVDLSIAIEGKGKSPDFFGQNYGYVALKTWEFSSNGGKKKGISLDEHGGKIWGSTMMFFLLEI